MRLTLVIHPITEIRSGATTRLDGTRLEINKAELERHLLEDTRLASADFEIVRPGENCRVGGVIDILEPRAKDPGSIGSDFPGILSPFTLAGQGTTHVLRGAAVTLVGEGGGTGATRILPMSGPPADASAYGRLQHLVVLPRGRPGVDRHQVAMAAHEALLKTGIYLAQVAFMQPPATMEVFDLDDAESPDRKDLPRVVYIGQVFSHQSAYELDEKIIYAHNTVGLVPVPLHPNEWLDGGVMPSSSGNMDSYFYQNHPVILGLYRRHKARKLNFAGTIVTASAVGDDERYRNCMVAANLAKWCLRADIAVLTKTGGGAPHADMGLTAHNCELAGIKTSVQVNDSSVDGRAESALLFNYEDVNAIVDVGGRGVIWKVPAAERVIALNPAVAARLAPAQDLAAQNVCGVTNQQGASRLRTTIY